MNNGFPLFDILFFALVAAFLIFRLRQVLGRRPPDEESPQARSPLLGEAAPMSAHLPESEIILPEKETPQDGAAALHAFDPQFDAENFLKGAAAAFRLIIQAYAAGDSQALKPLLSKPVYRDFIHAIREREKNGYILESTIVSLAEPEIIDIRIKGPMAEISVRFVSEQTNVMRDHEGQIREGSPDHIAPVTDLWVFSRNIRSSDPNWILVETNTPE